MVNTKNLKDAVKKTADKLAKNTAKTAEMVKKSKTFSNSRTLKDHKHCRECGKMISPSSDDLLCKSKECIDKSEKNLKVKKQLRLWFIVLVVTILGGNLYQMGII